MLDSQLHERKRLSVFTLLISDGQNVNLYGGLTRTNGRSVKQIDIVPFKGGRIVTPFGLVC